MKKLSVLLFLITSFLLFSSAVSAQTKIRVKFAKGASGTTLKGTIVGYGYKDYVVSATAGQRINVHLKGSAPSTVFSVFLPGGDNLEAAAESDQFSGELPVSGNYAVRVLMMRSQARRKGSISNYTLKISIN